MSKVLTVLAFKAIPVMIRFQISTSVVEKVCLHLNHYRLHVITQAYSMNYLFFNLSRKYCCDANIVATKCAHFESVHFDQ